MMTFNTLARASKERRFSGSTQRNSSSVVFRLLALCAAGLVQMGSASADTTLSDLDTYRATYVRSMVREQAEQIITMYGPQSRVMPEYQETGIGPAAAEAYYAAYFDRFDVQSFEKTVVETMDFEKIIVEIGTFEIEQQERSTSKQHRWAGAYFDVWERDARGQMTLVSQAWNYDEAYDRLRELAHFEVDQSTPAQRLPGIPIKDRRMYEVRALREMGRRTMMSGQPHLSPLIYADDAMYSPHDAPMMWGIGNIRSFLKDYSAFWPPFEFVDTSTDRIDFLGDHIVEHMSYNLRWIGEDQTGVSTGKGIRVWKRSDEGLLQSYRQISMHDY